MNIMKNEMTVVERSANVLSLVFINGGMLGRELSTVISTSHTALGGKSQCLVIFTVITMSYFVSSSP